ncbi:HD domain-containing protein [Sinobacterium caligoides]|uniref:HD domain-containing protein n=1 Tax=Sinobacterium caligoides TaxID=933926 RepID=A0A3N2DMW2_9GAMM|nr:response regulator [Sinobacterium caligoides]ROS01110.1 HD domain-containing protein [Sinobacterium caligoides]
MNPNTKILCVDDDPNILDSMTRSLYQHCRLTTALSGKSALEEMDKQEFAVIISDMRMPQMDGASFLALAKQKAPNSTRLLLTGHADIDAAGKAINEGNIFRFLFKPCVNEELISHLQDANRLHQLNKIEKELLENTLKGAINMLNSIMSITAPEAFSRTDNIKRLVVHMARCCGQSDHWQYEMAAMLSHVGCITLPPALLKRAFRGDLLNDEEKRLLRSAPRAGEKMVANIPRLENVAKMIGLQLVRPEKIPKHVAAEVRSGATMLRVAHNLDNMMQREGIKAATAASNLSAAFSTPFEQQLLRYTASFELEQNPENIRQLSFQQLRVGMTIDEDVLADNGSIVLCRGQRLSAALIDRLLNFSRHTPLKQPVRAIVSASVN